MRRAVRLPLEQLQSYLLDVPPAFTAADENGSEAAPAPGVLNWPAVFGNDHPVEVEVGSGKGLFLLTAAQSYPDVNFVGIEIERKYVLFLANRVAKRGLSNVRLVCGDARVFLRDHVARGSLRAVHVYFPDPWWKTRHRKRRVFTDAFVGQCARVLGPGGRLYVVTDVEDYFAVIAALTAGAGSFHPLPLPDVSAPRHDLDYLTNFERKYRREGRPIYRANYERVEGAPPEDAGQRMA